MRSSRANHMMPVSMIWRRNLNYYLIMKSLNILLTENLYDQYTKEQERLYESLLKSYDPYKLIQSLEKKFGSNIVKYARLNPSEYDKLCVAGFVCTPENESFLKDNQDFQSILNLFNYTFSYSYPITRNGHTLKMCVLEPNITGDYSKIVYDEWGGIVYHVTLRQYIDSILKNGIRPKSAQYRDYDKRIFVTGGEDFKRNLSLIIDDLGYRYKDYVVLKINLNKNPRKIKLFRDPVQENGFGLYTRESIDKKCIEIYNLEDTL